MGNKKILFICRNYGDPRSACGICIQNLVDEFKNRGFEVWVISVTKDPIEELVNSQRIHYYAIKEGWFTTFNRKSMLKTGWINSLLFKLVYLIRLPYVLYNFPVLSRRLEKELISLLRKLIKKNDISYVVGTNSPFEPIKATIEIKKEFKTAIKAICYHLDPILLQTNNSKAVNIYKRKKAYSVVVEESNTVDLIMAQQSTRGLISKPNIEYVDFPLYITNNNNKVSGFAFSHEYINITYIGTLDEDNRNPLFFIKLLNDVYNQTQKQCMLHIWGFVRDSVTLEKLKAYSIFVTYHGMIDPSEVMDILQKSDILLNISNKVSYNAVPSKIFQLFSTKKPLINIIRHREDYAKRYFEKYPSVFFIEEYLNDADSMKMAKYIDNSYGKAVEISDSLYESSTPRYISDLIIR